MVKKTWRILLILFVASLVQVGSSFAADPVVSLVTVEGNEHVVSEHILGTVGTRAGDPLSREQLQKDVEAIYGLGFFSFVDINLQSVAGGVAVTYIVQENPVVETITFTGNNIYKDEELLKVVFTMPGTVFNRVFFRNDLDRIQEKYHKDGYVMVKIADVQVEKGIIDVKIVEPVVGNIIIQGNKRTKTKVIAREIKLKKGDPFNATILRHSLSKLQNRGFFEDVSVGFEPGENPEMDTDIILTVTEQKTGRLGFSVSHGSASGWSGGLSYADSNWGGLGHRGEIGFETGDNEQYWATYTEPYMDAENYSWKIGLYRRKWEDRYFYKQSVKQFEFNEDRKGFYLGAGKKFKHDDKLSWYVTLDWSDTDYSNVRMVPGGVYDVKTGKIFQISGVLTKNNTDEYLSYPKGNIWDLNVDKGFEALGGDYSFTKYWLQARYYIPLTGLADFFGAQFGTDDNPAILAARLRVGFSSGELPTVAQYSLGGTSTLRGYDYGRFEGDSMFLANIEARIPIEKAFSLVIFYDTGNSWRSQSIDFSDLYDSWGVGVRIKTPLGNFRFDHATGKEESMSHFGFGEMF